MYAGLVAALTVATVPVASRAAQALAGDGSPSLAYDTPADGSDAGGSAAAAGVASPLVDVTVDSYGTDSKTIKNVRFTLYRSSLGSDLLDLVIQPKDDTVDDASLTYWDANGYRDNTTLSNILSYADVSSKLQQSTGESLDVNRIASVTFAKSGERRVALHSLRNWFKNWSELRSVDFSGADMSKLMPDCFMYTFEYCAKLDKIDGWSDLTYDDWKNAIQHRATVDNLNGGSYYSGALYYVFDGTAIRSLDFTNFTNEYGWNDHGHVLKGTFDNMTQFAKVTYGTHVFNQGSTGYEEGVTKYPYGDGTNWYWIDASRIANGNLPTVAANDLWPSSDSGALKASDVLDYHTDNGWDQEGKRQGRVITYVLVGRPSFDANGGSWDYDANAAFAGASQGECVKNGIYYAPYQQMYNGEDADVKGIFADPRTHVSYGSRQFLGWFETQSGANSAASNLASGTELKDQAGYVDLSQPLRGTDARTLYAAWSSAQNIPVYDNSDARLVTRYLGDSHKDAASVANFDPGKVDAKNFTATNALTGETVTVTVEGTSNDWKLKVDNDANGKAPLRVEVTPGGYDQASGTAALASGARFSCDWTRLTLTSPEHREAVILDPFGCEPTDDCRRLMAALD